MPTMPAVSLAAVPGRRVRTVELAQEIESRGFTGIFGPSMGDVLALCLSIAHSTTSVAFGSSIQPIYTRRAADIAATASYIAEIGGVERFHLGLGVSHEPAHRRLGVTPGKPLADTRAYVEEIRAAVGEKAPMPKIVLATLRKKMLALAVEIADGAVWANGARSHMAESLSSVGPLPDGFFIGNMIPTTIDDDRSAAAAVNRKTLTGYVALPNYRNYWKEAGYVEEMDAIEAAITAKDFAAVPGLMSDRWLSDVTLYGSAGDVREGVEAWVDAGVSTPILVPSSTSGGQLKALDELFAAFAA